jgi:protein ImuB
VQIGMGPRQAQTCCPEVHLQELDINELRAEQSAFEATLAAWELPVERQEWGSAYIDLHAVARHADAVQPLAAELGQRVRRTLGDALQPALGWDSGKFTARAAAMQVPPGRMRLVDKVEEVRFLSPLPVTLLPLPRPHLQQLHWLGVRTLGQFAQLPPAAVWQRFGATGKLAQRWAQGCDDRPVRAAVAQAPAPVTVTLDPPAARLQPVVDALMASIGPVLAAQAAGLEGVRRLHVALAFVTGGERVCELTFVEPASQPGRVQAALVQQICGVRWLAEVEAARWTLLETGELAAPQLSLFAETPTRLAALSEIAEKLGSRYGALFFQGRIEDGGHPLPERRSRFLWLNESMV